MPQMLRLVFSLLLLGTTWAQIPLPCSSHDVMTTGECCPIYWEDSSPCGSALGRGECQDIMVETPQQRVERIREQENTEDFRRWWPSYLFQRMCVCNENFWGADCGECKYGWRGSQCQERHVVVRRDFTNMTKEERDIFIDRLYQSKYTLSKRYAIYASSTGEPNSPKTFREGSVYNVADWVHYICAKPLISESQPSFAHRSCSFLVWHRLYLMYLEREIRNITQDENFFLPVWTWAGKSDCDVCTNELFGSNDDEGNLSPSSIFSTWQTYCSGDGANLMDFGLVCPPSDGDTLRRFNRPDIDFGGLPTWDDVNACLSIENFDNWPYDATAPNSFRCALEGFRDPQDMTVVTASMHNLVHVFCGGTLNSLFEASNDPLFSSIHAYVDKIFEEWLRNHQNAEYPIGEVPLGHRATDKMVPFLPLWENQDLFKPCTTFGYDYVYDE